MCTNQLTAGSLQESDSAKLSVFRASALKQAGLKLGFVIVTFFGSLAFASAQDEPKKYELSGYLKTMGTFSFFNTDYLPPFLPTSLEVPTHFEDYLIHNRFDFQYYPNDNLSFGLGMRNRLFIGYRVNEDPFFYDNLDSDQGFLDLSYLYWESDDVLLHTIFDRAWAQWESQKWIIRLGRQRINWGVNTVWNPNDIFNQYNYLDFDYEERPGSDALRLQYFPNFNNTFELAFAPAEDFEQSTGALLYKTNKWNYDFQFLGGYYKQDAVAGLGWAGNIKGAGFKGEATYYQPLTEETESNLTASASVDYMFGNGLYSQVSYLYNGLGSTALQLGDFNALNSSVQTAKDLFFFKHTLFASAQYSITPLLSATWATMLTPDLDNFILFPSLSYSLHQDLDALLALQYFISENAMENNNVEWLTAAVFVRLKWSF
jgi:hypothetical protein